MKRFPTTHWGLVRAARGGPTAPARAALAALCAAYWYPLYAFVRRKGHDADAAQDLVQEFFARLLEGGGLAAVDHRKGRFRSFLMAACTHFLANQADRERALKRGGGRVVFSLDGPAAEGRYEREPAHELTAERLFERRWALTVLERALERLEGEQTRAGQGARFAALRPALLGSAARAPYGRIAHELGLSEAAARAAAARLRRRYRALLREEVAQTLDAAEDLEDEIRALFVALGE